MPTDRKTMVAAVSLVALLFGACTSGDDKSDATQTPRRTPSVEAVADFQLVGTIDEAFTGSEPLIEIPEGGVSGSADASPTGSPGATPVGETPARPGVLRIVIDDLNEELSESCDVSADSSVDVFWTTDTRFEPGDDLDDIEDAIEGRVAGISGSIYRTSGSDDDCVLIAEQVGLTTGSTPSTPRPVIRRTASPTPQRTATATPSASKTPKASDTPEPTSSATSSASESPRS